MIRRLIPWILMLVAAAVFYSKFSGKNASTDSWSDQNEDSVADETKRLGVVIRMTGNPIAPSLGIPPSIAIRKVIETIVVELGLSNGPEDSRRIVSSLKQAIASASDSQAAASAIADFLRSGQDVSTGLPFSVGSQGVMQDAPSLRIALLDLMPSLDPNLSLDVAREIMDHTHSADEYALCLRNLAWNDFEGDLRNELSDRFERMIKTDVWLGQPTAGFLEAMDAAVEISDLRQFRNLTQLMAKPDQAIGSELQRAVSIALDRMVLRNPSLLVESFATAPLLNDLPPILRASLLSRLDITKADEQEVFSTYLEAANHGEGELEYFGDLFPNGNYVQGHRLITKDEPSLSIEERLMEDLKVLNELEKWGTDAPESILRIRERLLKSTSSRD